jgi:hypothetical protein
VRQPFYLRQCDVPLVQGWRAVRISDVYDQLPVGKRYDAKTVSEEGKVPVVD